MPIRRTRSMSPGLGPKPARLSRCRIFWSSVNCGVEAAARRLRPDVETFAGSGINRSSTKAPAGRSGLSGATGEAGGLAGGCCAANGIAKTSASARTPTRRDSERTRIIVCMLISYFLCKIVSRGSRHHITPKRLSVSRQNWPSRLCRPICGSGFAIPRRTHLFLGYAPTLQYVVTRRNGSTPIIFFIAKPEGRSPITNLAASGRAKPHPQIGRRSRRKKAAHIVFLSDPIIICTPKTMSSA